MRKKIDSKKLRWGLGIVTCGAVVAISAADEEVPCYEQYFIIMGCELAGPPNLNLLIGECLRATTWDTEVFGMRPTTGPGETNPLQYSSIICEYEIGRLDTDLVCQRWSQSSQKFDDYTVDHFPIVGDLDCNLVPED